MSTFLKILAGKGEKNEKCKSTLQKMGACRKKWKGTIAKWEQRKSTIPKRVQIIFFCTVLKTGAGQKLLKLGVKEYHNVKECGYTLQKMGLVEKCNNTIPSISS